MDRFDAMKAFVRVIEAGSFTKAAQTLHMSRSTVTQQVQQLEACLRLKLLSRTTRKVNVTEDGALCYERTVRVLAELEDVEASPGCGRKNGAISSPAPRRV
jgi:DNA-binding transcriptional LysR family regulator